MRKRCLSRCDESDVIRSLNCALPCSATTSVLPTRMLARRELLDELAVLVEELGAQRQLGVAPDPAPRVEHADLEREVSQVGDHHLLLGVAVRPRCRSVYDVVEDLQVAPRPGRRRLDPARRDRRRRERVAHPGAAEHAGPARRRCKPTDARRRRIRWP